MSYGYFTLTPALSLRKRGFVGGRGFSMGYFSVGLVWVRLGGSRPVWIGSADLEGRLTKTRRSRR